MKIPLMQFFTEKFNLEKLENDFSEEENELRKELMKLLMEENSKS